MCERAMMPAAQEVALTPLFRSDTQFKVLGELAGSPTREWSIQELASKVGAPYATVWREVNRLRDLGVVAERRAGSAVQIRFDDSVPYAAPLRQLLAQSYGPLPELADQLREVTGIADAYIYGSWARRYAGHRGPAPRDVDVLVLVHPDADPLPVYQACARASERTGTTVNATVLTVNDWGQDSSSFAEEVRTSPQVGLLDDSYGKVLQ